MQPESVTAAIEVDGLLQRFGRVVPDVAALCERLGALKERIGRLDLCLIRIGAENEAALLADLESLEVAARYRELGFQFRVATSAADLQRLGKRTMLFAGSAASTLAAIECGIAAYLVSDRRLRDHRQLHIVEVDRTLAEALHVPVPRPMSPQSRKGSLLASDAGSPSEVRRFGRSLLLQDPRADWTTLGERLVAYVELQQAKEQLAARGAVSIAEEINLTQVGLCRDEDREQAILAVDEWRLATFAPGMIPWSGIRRARIGAASYATSPFTVGARSEAFDSVFAPSFVLPFEDEEAESIIAIVEDDTSLPLAMGLAHALRRCGETAGFLLCATRGANPPALDTLLWEQEENRVSALVTASNGPARVARTSNTGPPWMPLTVSVELPGSQPAALEQAARQIRILTGATTLAPG